MRLTIGKKLAVGFGVVLLLLGVLGVASLRGVGEARESTVKLAEMTSDLAVAGSAIDALGDMRMAIQKVARLKDADSVRGFEEAAAAFDKRYAELDGSIQNPDRRRMLAALKADYDQYVASARQSQESLVEWRSTIEQTLHPMNNGIRAEMHTISELADAHTPAELNLEIQRAIRMYYDGAVSVKHYFALGHDVDAQDAGKKLGSVLAVFETALPQIEHRELRQRVGKARSQIAEAVTIFGGLREIQDQASETMTGTLDVIGPRMSKSADELVASLVASAGESRDATSASVATLRATILIVGGVAIVFGVGVAFLIARSILGPINSIVTSLKDIAEGDGDLTARVQVKSSDEVGELARYFNLFVTNIHKIISDVAQASGNVAAGSTQIAASAEQIAAGLARQSTETDQVAAAVEEMASSVSEVAGKSTEAADAARRAGEDASAGGEVIRGTIDEMGGISTEVGQTRDAVAKLGEQSEQIGEIISVINDIADQTNLLALNAAIEAARAGEHGRGFAVVADEVRKLAERTQQATEEVSRSIRSIQDGTARAVQRIEASTGRVNRGVELSREAGSALEAIFSGSETVQSMVRSIAAAAEEQSAASNEIARSIERIRAVTGESSSGADQAAAAAADLSRSAEQLRGLVTRFKL